MIRVNGKEREWREGMTVMSLLHELQVHPESTVVELNRNQIILRSEYERSLIRDGDRVEIISYTGRR